MKFAMRLSTLAGLVIWGLGTSWHSFGNNLVVNLCLLPTVIVGTIVLSHLEGRAMEREHQRKLQQHAGHNTASGTDLARTENNYTEVDTRG